MNAIIKRVKDFTLTTKEKAVAGAVVAAVTTYLAESGLTLDQVLSKNGLYAFIVGVLVHLSVYFTPNSAK